MERVQQGERASSVSVSEGALQGELVFAGLAGTVVNTSLTVAVAAIAQDLDASLAVVAAIVLLGNVAMAFCMPLVGMAVVALGSRRLLVGAGGLVVVASILMAAAPNLVVIGVARFLQGVGLAASVPASVEVATHLLDGPARARALGWWAAANGAGLAGAPLLGGVLIDLAGWRWVLVPSGLVALGLALTAHLGIPDGLRPDPGASPRDMLGLGLVTGSVMTTIAAASAGAWALAAAAGALCSVATLDAVRRHRRTGALAPVVRWARHRLVRRTVAGAGLQMMVNGMAQVTVPAWLVVTGVLDAGPAALVLMTMTLTMAVMGPVVSRASGVPYRRLLVTGLLACGVGAAGLSLAAGVGPWGLSVPALLVVGIGAGCLLSPSLTTFSHTDAGGTTVGLSLFNMLRLSAFAVGGLVGGAALDQSAPWVAFAVAAAVCTACAAAVRAGPAG